MEQSIARRLWRVWRWPLLTARAGQRHTGTSSGDRSLAGSRPLLGSCVPYEYKSESVLNVINAQLWSIPAAIDELGEDCEGLGIRVT